VKIDNQTPYSVEAIPFMGPGGQAFLTVLVKGTFTMPDQGPALLADEQMPIAFGDEPFDEDEGGSVKFESDLAPFKPRADIVLVGHAYAPPGKLVTGMDVSARVGALRKVIRVFGDRTWQYGTFNSVRWTDPAPFDKMPLVYERAFGGVDMANGGYCDRNLVGCGYLAKPSKKTANGARLPNIEDPDEPIRTPEDQPRPVGYGFYGRTWEPRMGLMGTFDKEYRKKYAPDPPPDFKLDYYNGAHPDLQASGYLQGGEDVELINLSADGTLRFALPGQHPMCVVEKTYERLEAFVVEKKRESIDPARRERSKDGSPGVELKLDTLCLMPDEKRFYMVWRGRSPVYDQTALEIEKITVA